MFKLPGMRQLGGGKQVPRPLGQHSVVGDEGAAATIVDQLVAIEVQCTYGSRQAAVGFTPEATMGLRCIFHLEQYPEIDHLPRSRTKMAQREQCVVHIEPQQFKVFIATQHRISHNSGGEFNFLAHKSLNPPWCTRLNDVHQRSRMAATSDKYEWGRGGKARQIFLVLETLTVDAESDLTWRLQP